MEVQWFSAHNQSGAAHCSVKRRSADVSSAVISFNDADLAQQFQSKINHYLSKLNESYMFGFSRGLRPQERILFMGWVSLALPKSASNAVNLKHGQLLGSSLDYKWQPKYMIIRGGELLLYDCVPDYLLDKLSQIPYANDTLIEFNELSRLLVNPNGVLACSITLNGGSNLNNRPKSGSRKSTRLTRHLSIRGRDSSLDPSHRFHVNDPSANSKILTETTSNNKRSSNGSRLISTLTRNLSLKTAKENRYNKQPTNKARSANPHCTLPRGQRIDQQSASSQLLERNLKRTGAESNLLRANDLDLLNQPDSRQPFAEPANCQPPEVEWENRPIIFKAYQSVLRQLKPEEQLDKRENCLLALTTQSDCVANPMSTFGKHSSVNRSTGELQENNSPNAWYSARKNSLDEQRQAASSASVVAYLAVEHAENIPQILKSWNVCTMHSVVQLSVSSEPEEILSFDEAGHDKTRLILILILLLYRFVLAKIIPGRFGGQVRLSDVRLEHRLYALRRTEREVVVQIFATQELIGRWLQYAVAKLSVDRAPAGSTGGRSTTDERTRTRLVQQPERQQQQLERQHGERGSVLAAWHRQSSGDDAELVRQ